MSEYFEITNASKPTFGDYVTIEMKRYGVPNEYFIHEVLTQPFISNSWRVVPLDSHDREEHIHETSEPVISVCTQGFHLPSWRYVWNVRVEDILPMKGDGWAWRESPLRARIAELEKENAMLKQRQQPIEDELRARIAEVEAERWIPVSERMPEDGKPVWVCTIWNEQHSGFLIDGVWGGLFRDFREGEITYWMSLPEPPESPNDTQTQTVVYGKVCEE